jgi:hypothetical protein
MAGIAPADAFGTQASSASANPAKWPEETFQFLLPRAPLRPLRLGGSMAWTAKAQRTQRIANKSRFDSYEIEFYFVSNWFYFIE